MNNPTLDEPTENQAVSGGPSQLRKLKIEERLEKVALDGLCNIYRAITGKDCERYVSLGVATSAVSKLKHSHAALYEALKYAVENIQGIMDGNDIPSIVIRDKGLAALALAGQGGEKE